ncbi:MAG: hypothetical protein DMF80_13025 [Acidobacteria bacterium]|nr:MAG: hypothetical protein DMF80_13025 [Acidobacteriota bacterium]
MRRLAAPALALVAVGASRVGAEPIFLSRQYTRCTTCHFSPTGGGLLTPYGRSLSREELSTTGRSHPSPSSGKQDLRWSVAEDRMGPVSIGIDVRPAHLDVRFEGGSATRDLLMTADVLAAYQANGWTVYGEVGRQPRPEGTKVDSYEYWVAHQAEKGFGFRAGRFLPAYGVRLADHTAFTRAPLGLDVYDQIYGLEVSHTGERHLLQLTAGPGRADSILHEDGRRAFTAAGRLQMDLGPRSVLVVSGLVRNTSAVVPRNGSGGVAFGFAPLPRLTTWTEADAQVQHGVAGAPAYVLLNETGWEVYRGLWLKFSPQLRTELGNASGGVLRLLFEANLLPRTRWNVDVSFYRDRGRASGLVTRTLLAQLHLYL